MRTAVVNGGRKRTAFLKGLTSGMTVARAAREARLALRTLYNWRHQHAEFRKAWDAARLTGDDAMAARLEAEADRRAVRGYREPIYFSGKLVGHRRKYSDTLLMFRLRALRPQRYAVASKSDESVTVVLRDLDAEEGTRDGS